MGRLLSRRNARKAPPKARARRRGRWIVARRLLPYAARALPLGLAVAATGWLWTSGMLESGARAVRDDALTLSAEAGLAVRQVYLEGRVHASLTVVRDILGVSANQPILAFRAATVKATLESLPWVRNATVERRLPDIIHVRIFEHMPIALWQSGARMAVIDRAGAVIAREGLERFSNLPLLVGRDAARHGATLLSMLAREPALARQVTAAVRVGGRRWDVRLDSGAIVKLPEHQPAHAWATLARLDRDHGLLARALRIVDLRFVDRVILRLPERPDGQPLVRRSRPRPGHET